jgi:hypothetical protein
MKKIIAILSLVAITSLNACLCSADIIQGFSSSTNQILSVLQSAEQEINTNINPAIRKNIQDIEEQNRILDKIIAGYVKRNEQKKELIYLLKKLKGMQD